MMLPWTPPQGRDQVKRFPLILNVVALLLLALAVISEFTDSRWAGLIGAGGLVIVGILQIILQFKRLKTEKRENR
jgi:hypothetical protein